MDDNEAMHGAVVNGHPVLGTIDWLIAQNKPYSVAIGIGIPKVKEEIVRRLRPSSRLTFPSLVAPSALIGEDVTIGEGVVICDGTIVTSYVRLGAFTMLNLQVTVSQDCDLGEFVTVSPGANLSGYTSVGDGTDIGTNVTVIPSKKLGARCIIGASACVTSNIPDRATAVGIPAKVIKQG